MGYLPTPGSNIAQVYECVTVNKQTTAELLNRIRLKHPNNPIASVNIHLRYLIKKKVIVRRGDFYYRTDKNANTDKISKSQCILQYCKQKIGKKINSTQLIDHCCEGNKSNTAPATALKSLATMGVITRIEGTSPYEYLVLPEIKILDKISTTLPAIKPQKPIQQIERIEPKDNIADLSIGQILTEYVSLKDENRRLKDGLQRIAHELFQLGELEK